jgi:hypothetical protein
MSDPASQNPLHEVIRILSQFFRAVWACHHAHTEEMRKQTLDAWTAEKSWFWSKFERPVEAIRGLADPALAWCSQRGFQGDATATVVENGARIITELAMMTNPSAMPHVYANKSDAANVHEREGKVLLAADRDMLALRELAARTGDAWQAEPHVESPTAAGKQTTSASERSKPLAGGAVPAERTDPDKDFLDIKARARVEQQARDDRRNAFRERAEKDQLCRDAVKALFGATEALWSAHPRKTQPLLLALHRALCDACKALAQAGRLEAWEQNGHDKTYKTFCAPNLHVMSRASYDWARAIFDRARTGNLPVALLTETWETESLQDAIRWLRVFVAGLSGEGAVLSDKMQVQIPANRPAAMTCMLRDLP